MRASPPTLDLRSPAFKDDPMPTWRRLHDGAAVIRTRQPLLGRVALATRHAEAMRVLQEGERFSVDARRAGRGSAAGMQWWVPGAFRPLARNLLTYEGEAHRALRTRVDRAFQRPRLEALQPRVDAIAAEAIDALGRATARDFVRHVARPVPQRVIGELLGLTLAPDVKGPFERAIAALSSVHGPLDLFRVLPAVRRIGTVIRAELAARRREPRDDLLSALVAPHGEGRALDDEELLSMVFLLYVAGHETTTHLLSTALLTVLREPRARARLETPLTTGAATELLRYLSPVQMGKPRFVVEDLEIGGARLRRGETIAPLVAAANADPRWIEDGYRLDLERRAGRHLAFGAGPHVCLGLQLALRETRAVLDALFERHPDVALPDPGAPPAWTRRLGLRALAALPLAGLRG